MADVVFIVGAGCSKDAGAPTSEDFLDKARDLLLSGELETRREEFALLFEVIGLLQRVHSKAKLDLTNLESVFSALDIGWTLRKLPGIDVESKIVRVLSAMRWVIVKTLEHTIEFPVRDTVITAPHSYVSFVDVIKKTATRRPPLSTAVITFNYDVCLDVALDDAGIRFTYGFDTNSYMPLLKLHGSMNWARRTSDGEIIPWSIQAYRQKYQLSFPFPKTTAVKAHISRHMHAALKLMGEEIAELPVLIPPLLNKGDEQRQLWQVWQKAAKELTDASYVVVLGYSLPDTDQFFRLLFALGTEGKKPLRKLIVLNPDDSVERRFKEMLGDGALKVFDFRPAVFSSVSSFLTAELGL